MAEIVGWENKQQISPERLQYLDKHIKDYQPGEEKIYLTTEDGREYKNLISVFNLKRISNHFSVSNLIKVSDGKPLQPRTQ